MTDRRAVLSQLGHSYRIGNNIQAFDTIAEH